MEINIRVKELEDADRVDIVFQFDKECRMRSYFGETAHAMHSMLGLLLVSVQTVPPTGTVLIVEDAPKEEKC